MTHKCESSWLSPTFDENVELARYVLEPYIRTSDLVILGKVNPEKVPVAIGFWNLMLPDHCCGEHVFLAAVLRHAVYDCWQPVILVSCTHFEHGDMPPDMENLLALTRIVCMEVFGLTSCRYWIRHLSFSDEEIVMEISPGNNEYCSEDLKKAIRRFAHILAKEPTESFPEWIWK